MAPAKILPADDVKEERSSCTEAEDVDSISWIESSLSDDDTVGALSSSEESGYVDAADDDMLHPEVLDILLEAFPEA
jgi:hypothetical protein